MNEMSSTKRGGIPPERVVKRLRSTNESEQPTSLPPEVWAGVMECKFIIHCIVCKIIYVHRVIGFVYEMTL